MVLCIHRI